MFIPLPGTWNGELLDSLDNIYPFSSFSILIRILCIHQLLSRSLRKSSQNKTLHLILTGYDCMLQGGTVFAQQKGTYCLK